MRARGAPALQRIKMTEIESGGPSLIKMGKLANTKEFDKLAGHWEEALNYSDYTWRELLPIAGQVGRQNAPDRAETLMVTLLEFVEEKEGAATALEAVLVAVAQLPKGKRLLAHLERLYVAVYPDFAELPDLLALLLPKGSDLSAAVKKIEMYLQLQPGAFAQENTFLVPGIVEQVDGKAGVVSLRFDDRRTQFGMDKLTRLRPRPADYFPALALYEPDRLRALAADDPAGFVLVALRSNREGRIMYKELKARINELLGEKGWKDWWNKAKPALKRDEMIGMGDGSQPSFRLLRQADKFEDRLRREFDFAKRPLDKLLKVMACLDGITREEKNGTVGAIDQELLVYLGNGAAKVAVAMLQESPSLALAGLALHAEVAARGVAVARPNPRAAATVVGRIDDLGVLTQDLPEALLQRVLLYLQQAMPEDWGRVWAAVLLRSGKRLCDAITRGLIEGGQTAALGEALLRTVDRPTSSPELMGWMWRNRFGSGPATKLLMEMPDLPEARIADAMFNLLDSIGNLYGMSLEEKHLKVLESARAALATHNSRPLLGLIDQADRREAIRLKSVIESNAGLSPSQRTQLLAYLRSRFGDIFIDVTREWDDGGTIYTTEDGLRTYQAALNHIITEEIPEVARQIGEAASFGDLSENAEYTAALEKRDQLASRAARMENELSVAKVINHEMAGSDFVNAGTRVTVRQLASGQEEVYTFLGPWDSDVEKKVLNYQAPLAMAFMGAKVGDTVEFGSDLDRRTWEILKIEPAV
jgi:transcription elongation GreA/GreB family factor